MHRAAAAILLAASLAPHAARAADPGPLAVELSRLALPEENWKKMQQTGAQQVAQYLQTMIAQSGEAVPPGLPARVTEEYVRAMPTYQEMLDLQAGLLVKHYTEAELRQLLAFYRTPLGRKAIRIMPEVAADASGQLMAMMQQRMPAVLERLKAEFEPAGAGKAAAPASKEPAAAKKAAPR